MESELQVSQELSFGQLFAIYIKTGKKRILLSIISGILVFLTITSLIMVVYTHRYNEFQDYQSEFYNWYIDDTISVSTNFIQSGAPNIENDTFNQVVNEFKSIVNNYIPGIGMDNYTAAISAQVYTFDPTIPGEPWLSHEFMALENDTYALLNDTIIEGRLPRNRTELLCYKGQFSDININDTVEIFSITELATPRVNYTVVGIVEQVESAFYNASKSVDILNWYFEDIAFYSYPKTNTFFMNLTQFDSTFNLTSLYLGVLTYLMDISWDTSSLQLNKLNDYVNNFPDELNPHESDFFNAEVLVAPDLFVMISGYSNVWVFEVIRILSLNSPLFLLIGLLLVITLTIGSKGLEMTYRRMKLYGLSYGIILRMIFYENLIFTLTSFIAGILFGIGTSILFTYDMPNRPVNFYSYFLVEPLLIISLVVFMIGFFILSFLIQNTIAFKTARTASEEYKRKRNPILGIFSSGEFRIFVIGLLFTVLSLGLYLIYRNVRSLYQVTTSLSYLTMMWFMISCSIAFLMIFFLLLIARLLTLLWTLLGQNLWKKNLNLFSLTLRHLSVNRSNYQLAFVGALLFGLLALPGLTVNQYSSSYLSNEANLQNSSVPILVPQWIDPDDELDSLFTNITEIANFTEITIFQLSNENEGREYPKAFSITLIGLEDPRNYTSVIDSELLNESRLSLDDIISLENESTVLLNTKHAKDQKVKPGEFFQTEHFTRYDNNLSLINTYEYFPMMPIAWKPLFTRQLDVFTIVGNRDTIRDVVASIDFTTEVLSNTIKLLKPVNMSVVPLIQQQLEDQGYDSTTYNEVYADLIDDVKIFAKNNLRFFTLLSSLILIFIGFYTGVTIYEERKRIMDSFYRSGAVRHQILGFFTLEIVLVNVFPIIITMVSVLPLIKFISTFYLGMQNVYFPFKPGIPWWLFLLLILLGIGLSLFGWLATLVPAIYRYRPVKQE